MTTEQSRRAGRVVGLTGMFAGLVLGLVTAASPDRVAVAAAPNAQKEEKKADYPKPGAGAFKLFGANNCKTCHNRDDPTAIPEYEDTKGYEFIRLWESKVWDEHDLHRTAYQNLYTARSKEIVEFKAKSDKDKKPVVNPTAQRMEDNLRLAGIGDKYKVETYTVATDTQCLACHASVSAPITKESHKTWTPASFTSREGVGCEMCHGHASKYGDEHKKNVDPEGNNAPPGAVKVVPWREWPTAVKRDWGLVNLRDPGEATARCASCHIGNTDEGRFVTHDMYAAGHPPLPPLDLIAYTREQPRHWGLPTEMPYLKHMTEKHAKKAEELFHIRAGESHVTRRFVESTIATLRASAVLGGQLGTLAGKDDGLDYAAFDCNSCHHNLKYPSDRQDRGYLGKPGRPLYRPATFALTKIVIEHAAGMEGGAALKDSLKDLLAAEEGLAKAFTNRSYGDGPEVAKATAKLVEWSDETMPKLAAVKYTPKATQELLTRVQAASQLALKDAGPRKRPVADPEVAQIYSWATETLLLELIPPTKDKDGKKLIPPAEATKLRESLEPFVVTRLRPHAMFHYEVEGGVPGPTVEPVDTRLTKRMETFNSFQGSKFRKAFTDFTLPKP